MADSKTNDCGDCLNTAVEPGSTNSNSLVQGTSLKDKTLGWSTPGSVAGVDLAATGSDEDGSIAGPEGEGCSHLSSNPSSSSIEVLMTGSQGGEIVMRHFFLTFAFYVKYFNYYLLL